MKRRKVIGLIFLGMILAISTQAHPIQDFYKKHKKDNGMEAQIVPPKIAAMWVDEDYDEAIDILKSMRSLKYLNFQGDMNQINRYAQNAEKAKGHFQLLLNEEDQRGNIKVFGERKNGFVRHLFAVVQTAREFVLVIGKGKLSDDQVAALPALAKEI
jgi:hypothetical protein